MNVFKTYFKIIKNGALVAILINITVGIIISTFFLNVKGENTKSFEESKPKITIFNNDNSEFTDKFIEYISDKTRIVKVDNNKNAKQQALFYRETSYIITIPQGFGDAFSSDNPLKLEIEDFPDATNSNLASVIVNNYLNTFNLYQRNTNLSTNEIYEKVIADLAIDTEVSIHSDVVRSHLDGKSMFYNFSNYIIMTILIVSIGTITYSFRSKDVRRRINCSTISLSSYNLQIGLGHFVVMLIVFAIVVSMGVIMYDISLTTIDGLLHLLNMFIFALVATSLAYMLSLIIPRRALEAATNVIVLGSCFLGGSFVPQEFLGDGVKATAIVNPTYWFVKCNNIIFSISDYSFKNMKEAYICMGIEILFAVVFLSITLVISKVKRTQD